MRAALLRPVFRDSHTAAAVAAAAAAAAVARVTPHCAPTNTHTHTHIPGPLRALQVWQEQQSRRWHDNPLIAADCTMLSPECIDLLNQMFEVDEAKRCAARAHVRAWFRVVHVPSI